MPFRIGVSRQSINARDRCCFRFGQCYRSLLQTREESSRIAMGEMAALPLEGHVATCLLWSPAPRQAATPAGGRCSGGAATRPPPPRRSKLVKSDKVGRRPRAAIGTIEASSWA
jgi:hypothetical protein